MLYVVSKWALWLCMACATGMVDHVCCHQCKQSWVREHARLLSPNARARQAALQSRLALPCAPAGRGESDHGFHSLFKAAWEAQPAAVPVWGPGSNTLPTVHAEDLAAVVLALCEIKPKVTLLVDRKRPRMLTAAVWVARGMPSCCLHVSLARPHLSILRCTLPSHPP